MGRAKLKVYYDSNCTKELKKNERDIYIMKINDLIKSIQGDFIKYIYVKNVGDKQTYSFNFSGSLFDNNIRVECIKNNSTSDVFYQGDTAKLKITIPNNLITIIGDKVVFIFTNYDDIAKVVGANIKKYNTVNKIAKRTCKQLEGLNMKELEWSYHELDIEGSFKVGNPKKEYDIKIIQ